MYCLPERLKKLRQSTHLSQVQLARLLGRTNDLSFDLFELTGEDRALLYKMVSALNEKNKRIRQLQER